MRKILQPEIQASPKVFISYAWESENLKEWVKDFATDFRNNGIDAVIDQWELAPGQQVPQFMESAIRDNQFVFVICTPTYQNKSNGRIGGVGYENNMMTAELLNNPHTLKFIPILKSGNSSSSIPTWLGGRYYIDLSTPEHYKANFEDVLATVFNARIVAPKLGTVPERFRSRVSANQIAIPPSSNEDKIRIVGIVADEVTLPRNDGTAGSALYKVPFQLSRRPEYEWTVLFVQAFNYPREFSTMHRSGIASVSGDKIYLDGTTVEEVEQYHKKTLKLAVEEANRKYFEILSARRYKEEQAAMLREKHKTNVAEVSKRLNFDD